MLGSLAGSLFRLTAHQRRRGYAARKAFLPVEKPDRVRVGGRLVEALEVGDTREVGRSLPRVRGRYGLGGVSLAQDHPRPSLLDKILA